MHKRNPIVIYTACIVLFLFLAIVNCDAPRTNDKTNTNKNKHNRGAAQNIPKTNKKLAPKKLDTAISFENTKVQYKLSASTFRQKAQEKSRLGDDDELISYVSEDESIATVDPITGVVRFVKAGKVKITANKGESEASYELTISNSLPELRYAYIEVVQGFTPIPYTNSSMVKPAGREEVSYTSGDIKIATVDSVTGAVRFVKLGTVKITASKGESEASYELTIEQGAGTTLSFTETAVSQLFTDETYQQEVKKVEVVGDAGAISYTSRNTDIATVDSVTGAVRFVTAGTVRITARKAATAGKYKAQTAWYELTIEGAGTTLSFTETEVSKPFTDGTYQQEVKKAEVVGDAGAISYTSSNPKIAIVDSATGIVTFLKAGTVKITATKAKTAGKYKEQTAWYDLTIEQAEGARFSFTETKVRKPFTDGSYKQAVTKAGVEGDEGAISYTSDDPKIATVHPTAGLVRFVKLGTVTIIATKAETAGKYKEQTASYDLTIVQAEGARLSFTETEVSQPFTDGGTYTQEVTKAGAVGDAGAISYTSGDTNIATVHSITGEVTFVNLGKVRITARKAGTADKHKAQTAWYDLTIEQGAGTKFSFGSPTIRKFFTEGPYTQIITKAEVAGDAGAISYISEDESIATVDSATGIVTFVKAGTVRIIARKAATAGKYKAQTASYKLTIVKKKMYLIGGGDKNDVWSFDDDGDTWTEETITAKFSARSKHQVVVFDSKMYLIGGGYKNDVWSSADGVEWNEVTAAAQFSARDGHQVVVFKGKMYLIGGISNTKLLNDVWSSSDGVNWTKVTTTGDIFSARIDHQVVVFKRKMYLIGGGYKNDVWSSENGQVWKKATTTGTKFSARSGHRVVVFNEKMYLIGGYDFKYKNDVWSSDDGGDTWTEETAAAQFSIRSDHQVVVFNEKMYLIGGYDFINYSRTYKNDVWSSDDDGDTWTEETTTAKFSARSKHQVVVFFAEEPAEE